jgi:uncharacterized HhH-GPD family protein
MGLMLSQQPEADALLDRDPLALVIGMVLDQQIPLEKAFSSPYVLAERLGHVPDAAELAGMAEDDLVAVFSKPPALHRFPGSMGKRVQAMCRAVSEQYDNDVTNVWSTAADGKELLKRIAALPGFGKQKAQIFVSLLAKQLGVRPDGWEQVVGDYALDGYRSVADVTDPASLQKVRDFKKAKKAEAKAAAATKVEAG